VAGKLTSKQEIIAELIRLTNKKSVFLTASSLKDKVRRHATIGLSLVHKAGAE
jgi:hypothetical protein